MAGLPFRGGAEWPLPGQRPQGSWNLTEFPLRLYDPIMTKMLGFLNKSARFPLASLSRCLWKEYQWKTSSENQKQGNTDFQARTSVDKKD